MQRRDFLRLRVSPDPAATLDLDCHHLYLQWMEATRACDTASVLDHDPALGEPPASFDVATPDAVIARLQATLVGVVRLRVLDAEWLQTTSLGAQVTPVLDAFRARGGQVVFDSTVSYT